jgi:hypothetical protein
VQGRSLMARHIAACQPCSVPQVVFYLERLQDGADHGSDSQGCSSKADAETLSAGSHRNARYKNSNSAGMTVVSSTLSSSGTRPTDPECKIPCLHQYLKAETDYSPSAVKNNFLRAHL